MAPHLLRGCAPQAALCARPSVSCASASAGGARRPRVACAGGAASRHAGAARVVPCVASGEPRAREAAPTVSLPAAAPTRRGVLGAGAIALLALAPQRSRADEEEQGDAPVRAQRRTHARRTPH
jgi:hypothetical protein